MAITQNTFTGNGSNLGPFSFTFKWLEPTDIKVSVGGVLKTAGTHYNLQNLNYTTKTGGEVLFTGGNTPASGAAIRVFRDTDDSALSATFNSGSAIRAQDLNDNFTQNLYVTQEINNNAVQIDGSQTMVGALDLGGYKVINSATATNGSDLTNKTYVDDRVSSAVVAGNPTFLQNGAGAVARSWSSKLKEVVSVKDFGAVGDGVADDTVAIQAAINAVAGSTGFLHLPPGTYNISSGLVVPKTSDLSRFTLQGSGATTSRIAAANTASFTFISLEGGACIVSGVSFNAGNGYLQTCIHDKQQMDDRYTTIRDCSFSGQFKVGIQADSNATNIESCSFMAGGTAIQADGPLMNSTIQANYIVNCQKGVVLNKASGGNQPEGLRIVNNTILGCNPGITLTAGLEIYISYNVIDISPVDATGILLQPGVGSSVALIKIDNNWINGGSGSTGACVSISSCDNHVLSRNTFNLTGTAAKPAVVLNTVNGIQVDDNIFWNDWTSFGEPISSTSVTNYRSFGNFARYGSPSSVVTSTVGTNLQVGGHTLNRSGAATFSRASNVPTVINRTGSAGSATDWQQDSTVIGQVLTAADSIRFLMHPGNNVVVRTYGGNPEGVITAGPGSLLMRLDTGKLYVKETGTGNTGWVIK